MKQQKYTTLNNLLFSCTIGLVYFAVFYKYLFALTSFRDPFEYMSHTLDLTNSFPYLDRIVLWLWLRFVSCFQIPPEQIGGIALLIVSSATIGLITWWLIKNIN